MIAIGQLAVTRAQQKGMSENGQKRTDATQKETRRSGFTILVTESGYDGLSRIQPSNPNAEPNSRAAARMAENETERSSQVEYAQFPTSRGAHRELA
jgi:hypothetical protein